MKKYRTKPTIIEAEQFQLTPQEKLNYEYGKLTFGELNWPVLNVMLNGTTTYYLIIDTLLKGKMKCSEKDWIIKDKNGNFHPCKPDIFEKTYELYA
jgi:hypothetical protein